MPDNYFQLTPECETNPSGAFINIQTSLRHPLFFNSRSFVERTWHGTRKHQHIGPICALCEPTRAYFDWKFESKPRHPFVFWCVEYTNVPRRHKWHGARRSLWCIHFWKGVVAEEEEYWTCTNKRYGIKSVVRAMSLDVRLHQFEIQFANTRRPSVRR